MLKKFIKHVSELSEWGCEGSFGHVINADKFEHGPVVSRVYHIDCNKYTDVITKVYSKTVDIERCPCCGDIKRIKKEYLLLYIPMEVIYNDMSRMLNYIKKNL